MPPRRKAKKLKIPENTVSDIDAYLERIGQEMAASSQQVSGSTDASYTTSSYDSSYRTPITGNVIPSMADPSSPRVRMVEEFMRHTNETGSWLEKWYSENYEKVEHYEYMRLELLFFLSEYMPGIRYDENITPHNLIELVKACITDLYTKFNRFNLDLREISGHEIAGYIQDHHRKVIEVVEDYEEKIKSANDEIAQCKDQIAHLDAELSAALSKITYLERGTAYYGGFEDSLSEEQFMADLHSRVAQSDALSSSLRVELIQERQENDGLQKQLAHLAREKVDIEEKCMREIVELSQRAEINSMLEHGIESLLKEGAKEPNAQDCQNVIDKWKNEINQVIDQNSKEIDELLKKIESQNNDMARLQAQANEQDEKLEEMQTRVKNSKTVVDKYKAEAFSLRTQMDEFKKVIEDIHNESLGLQRLVGNASESDQESIELNLIGPIGGEIPEHDLLSETQPLRSRRRRRRRPVSPLSPEISEGPSSPEEPPLPMQGLGVIRIQDDDEWAPVGGTAPIARDPISSRGQLRFVDGQWTQVGGSAQPPQPEPTRQAEPIVRGRPQQAAWTTVGGRVIPTIQEPPPVQQGARRFINGQWVSADPRSFQISAPLQQQSILQGQTQGQSRIPMQPATSRVPRGIIPSRLDEPGRQLAIPRAGTSHRLGASGSGSQEPRILPRVGALGRRPETLRTGMRPAASRAGTPPRPRVPTRQPITQRSRTPQRQGIPSMRTAAATPADRLSSRVMLTSPQRPEPLALDVDVEARNIAQSENEIVCEIAVRVEPVAAAAQGQNASRDRRTRRPRPRFEPRTGFQR